MTNVIADVNNVGNTVDAQGHEYLSLVEAHREGGKVGHRVLFRLGEAAALRSSGELDRVIAALSAHAEGRWLPVDMLAAARRPAAAGHRSARPRDRHVARRLPVP